MSRTVGSRLPQRTLDAFQTLAEDDVGLGYVPATTDADSRPRPAMLRAGDIRTTDDRTVRLAMGVVGMSALAGARPGTPTVRTSTYADGSSSESASRERRDSLDPLRRDAAPAGDVPDGAT